MTEFAKMLTENTSNPNHWSHKLSEGLILLENNRVSSINQAALSMLELKEEQALGVPLIAVLRDHRLEHAFLEQELVSCETRGRHLTAIPLSNGLVLQDNTEVIRSEKNAKELLAVLSHELRTPVTVIRSTLEALQGEVPDKLRKRFMERAVTESERLVRLLEDLTVDVKPPQYRRVDVTEVAQRALTLVQSVFAKHNVQIETRLEAMTVWADADKLLQIFINLLENAAIHGPDASEVKLITEISQEDSAFAQIKVQDKGEPLEMASISELFEPHSRGTSVKTKGTGLGLYIVQSIAKATGGEAWGRPLSAGNEFGVRVPLNR